MNKKEKKLFNEALHDPEMQLSAAVFDQLKPLESEKYRHDRIIDYKLKNTAKDITDAMDMKMSSEENFRKILTNRIQKEKESIKSENIFFIKIQLKEISDKIVNILWNNRPVALRFAPVILLLFIILPAIPLIKREFQSPDNNIEVVPGSESISTRKKSAGPNFAARSPGAEKYHSVKTGKKRNAKSGLGKNGFKRDLASRNVDMNDLPAAPVRISKKERKMRAHKARDYQGVIEKSTIARAGREAEESSRVNREEILLTQLKKAATKQEKIKILNLLRKFYKKNGLIKKMKRIDIRIKHNQ